MKQITEIEKCYGCGLCAESCPQGCITMEPGAQGFLIPNIDSARCIDCHLCEKKCIAANTIEGNVALSRYIGVSKDERIHNSSSSGGAYTEICKALDDGNTVYCGACFDEKLNVIHRVVKSSEDIGVFRKSKYVQSKAFLAFREIKECIDEGKRVVFAGTPCQVSAIKRFIGDNDRLYTIDLICTGVCSQGLFDKFLSVVKKHYKSDVTYIDMRYKTKDSEGWNIGNTLVELEGNKSVSDEYVRAYRKIYGQKVTYRDTCYSCKYATMERQGDFTIGDWWGEISDIPGVQEHNGISAFFINTEKGLEIEEELIKRMNSVPVSTEAVKADNPTLSHPTSCSKRRSAFKRDYCKVKDETLVKRYSRPELKVYIPWRLAQFIPKRLRSTIKRLILK